MLSFDIGLSAIQTSQQVLNTIANNISNASTPGYHRQRAELVDLSTPDYSGLTIGAGVDVSGITRLRDQASELALTNTLSLKAESTTLLDTLRQIETTLLPTEGALTSSVTEFFNQLEQLAGQPNVTTVRNSVVEAARQVIQQAELLQSSLNGLSRANAVVLEQEVDQVNKLAENLAEVNRSIRILENQGPVPNSLLDQRDRLINELAQLVEISPSSLLNTDHALVAAGGGVLIGERASTLSVSVATNGIAELTSTTAGLPITVGAGSIAGRVEALQIIDEMRQSLYEWTNTFVGTIDQIQATGLGAGSRPTEIVGTRSVSDADALLSELTTAFPVQAGTLFVNVTDQSTNKAEIHRIEIDPATDDLQQVLDSLNLIPNLTATYRSESGTVSLKALNGYSIDFTGGIEGGANAAFATGTSIPMLIGMPTEASNRDFTLTAVGSGTVGSTSPLAVEIREAGSGELIRTIDVGEGVVIGTPYEIVDGVSISFSSGTLVDGETIDIGMIGRPDETGLLTTLGLGTFFSGDAQSGVSLNPRIAQSSDNVAISRTGLANDTSQARRFIEARDLKRFEEGQENFEERLSGLTVAVAFRVQAEETTENFFNDQQQNLESLRDAVSGVDPNEEFLLMLEHQRAFQAAARFVSTLNQTLDELFRIVS